MDTAFHVWYEETLQRLDALMGLQAYVGVDEGISEGGYRCPACDELVHLEGQEEANQ